MSIVFGSSLVLTETGLTNPDLPRLCWRNIATSTNVSASDSGATGYPITNVTNPSTAFFWQAQSTLEHSISIDTDGQEIDYIGLARNNFTNGAQVRIQVYVGAVYTTLIDWHTVGGAQCLLYLINSAAPDGVRVSIRNNPTPPKLAVLYVGKSTVLQRGIGVGHTPITMGREIIAAGGYSESGEYLGSITRRVTSRSQVVQQNITPTFYRDYLVPFLGRNERTPFFFAWRPSSYNSDVGYCWITGNPKPSIQRSNGMMELTFDIEGII